MHGTNAVQDQHTILFEHAEML